MEKIQLKKTIETRGRKKKKVIEDPEEQKKLIIEFLDKLENINRTGDIYTSQYTELDTENNMKVLKEYLHIFKDKFNYGYFCNVLKTKKPVVSLIRRVCNFRKIKTIKSSSGKNHLLLVYINEPQ